jgi:cold shock CspA family protein
LSAFHRAHAGFAELRPRQSHASQALQTPAAASLKQRHRGRALFARVLMRKLWRGGLPSATSMAGEHVSTKGKVKFFNETKGYGFLTRDEGGDVFVHRTDLPADIGPLYEGRAMNFDVEMTTRGLRAIHIAPALGAE